MVTESYGKIASLCPSDTSEAQLLAAPALTEYVGILRICNKGGNANRYYIAHCDAGHGDVGADSDDWLFYNIEIPAYSTNEISITLKATETIRVLSSMADEVIFHLSGCTKVTSE